MKREFDYFCSVDTDKKSITINDMDLTIKGKLLLIDLLSQSLLEDASEYGVKEVRGALNKLKDIAENPDNEFDELYKNAIEED